MEVYAATYLIFTVICFFELFSDKKIIHKNVISILIYSIFVIQFGLRWEMGTDWRPYLINFENTDSIEDVLINVIRGFELGYGLLVLLVRKFTENYSVFLLVHALIFYGLVIM